MRCLSIHLKFRHWSLDGSFFVAQSPQFLWTTQFPNGYCTVCVCVDTRGGSIKYLVFVGKRDSSNWNSLLGMKFWCTSTILRHKHNPWHGSIHGPHHQKIQDINQFWETDGDSVFGTCMVCFCCTFLLLMKQSILLLIRPLSRNLIIIIMFIDCKWVDTRWQWSFNMLHMHGLWRFII